MKRRAEAEALARKAVVDQDDHLSHVRRWFRSNPKHPALILKREVAGAKAAKESNTMAVKASNVAKAIYKRA